MIALRPRDQHEWDPRPLPHETEVETKTNYCETETVHVGLETLTYLLHISDAHAVSELSQLIVQIMDTLRFELPPLGA